jgi:PAS domain S-box-containing protein
MSKSPVFPNQHEKALEAARDENLKLQQQLLETRQQLYVKSTRLEDLEASISGAAVGLWTWSMSDGLVSCTDIAINMFGYRLENVSNFITNWRSLVYPTDLPRVENILQEIAGGKLEIFSLEYRIVHPRQEVRWIKTQGKVFYDLSGKPVKVAGVNSDITQGKNAEHALKNSEFKYRNLFENSLVGIIRLSMQNGLVIEANNRCWEMLGIRPRKEVYLSRNLFDPDRIALIMRHLKEKGKVEDEELIYKNPQGREIWFSLSAVFYHQEGFVEAILQDITQLKKNIQELQILNSELDNFVYHSSHDLRSPLRSILGLVNLLRKEESRKGQFECMDLIEGSIARLDKLVKDLLSISRNSRIKDKPEPINLMVEVNHTIANFYHDTNTRKLEILPLVYHPYPFYSDLTRIRIILNNLISNALKYRNMKLESSYIRIEIRVKPETAEIIISDNGIGIPDDMIEKVFDMFCRVSDSGEGSGLGLYIVKNVVDKLKGEIKLESKLGEGSRFTVILPNYFHKLYSPEEFTLSNT